VALAKTTKRAPEATLRRFASSGASVFLMESRGEIPQMPDTKRTVMELAAEVEAGYARGGQGWKENSATLLKASEKTRRGADWAERYPRIKALTALDVESCIIDGEVVWCGPDGIADFAKLQSRAHDHQAGYAFDLLELAGEDLKEKPLIERKAKLARLIRDSDGLFYCDHYEGDGAIVFQHACNMGLEGAVSKKRDSIYVPGRSRSWIKAKPGERGDEAV
jgi:hypothetical protein